jgi:ABC-type transport system substrate-binding protein
LAARAYDAVATATHASLKGGEYVYRFKFRFKMSWLARWEGQGETVWAWRVTIAPAWFDPAETPAQITPFGMLYGLHDALVRPLPGERMGNSLAEFWTESSDGLVYELKLRRGLQFHNGDRCTAEDVQFSFAGARGLLHRKEASCTNVGRL